MDDELRRLLLEQGLTFKDARRRYTVGDGDKEKILAVVARWQGGASPRHRETLVHCAYWELYDERKK